jgi:hypothetical protein
MPIPGSGPGTGWPETAQRKGTRAVKRKFRLLREAAYKEGEESYCELLAEPGIRDFLCLYIEEGYKRSRHTGRVWRCKHGVLAISSHDTYFRTRLGAWIDLLKREWGEFSG